MDIVIVLDGSNSIYPWYEVQAFLINILQKFHVGPGQIQVCIVSNKTKRKMEYADIFSSIHPPIQVGVVQYGEKVVHEFKLSDYKSVEEVVKRARSINQRGGEETNTALGINTARYVVCACRWAALPHTQPASTDYLPNMQMHILAGRKRSNREDDVVPKKLW